MPIRAELRSLYPPHWKALSHQVRFERAGGRCQTCNRPHGMQLQCMPDGRWFDPTHGLWRDRRGRTARWPDLIETIQIRTTRVVLAAAHLDHNPTHNQLRNLRSLCQRCHMLHDRPHHLVQRWITYRQRSALGDFFLGRYAATTILDQAGWMFASHGVNRTASPTTERAPLSTLSRFSERTSLHQIEFTVTP
jgi:hypothetical protein